jgi:hypothetical protein
VSYFNQGVRSQESERRKKKEERRKKKEERRKNFLPLLSASVVSSPA